MKTDKINKDGSFAWLNATQFLGAMNDNVFKLLVILRLVHVLGDERQTGIVAIASMVFVIPFLLFSHAAGVLADKISKRTVIVWSKSAELAIMALGCIAILIGDPVFLYIVIFLMCTQSAFFGPSKFGIIPELVPTDRLSRANASLVALSYLAIILGTAVPPLLLMYVFRDSHLMMGIVCCVVAGAGIATSLFIRKTPPARADRKFSFLFIVDLFRTFRSIKKDKHLFLAVTGSAYFLFLGGFIQQNVFLYGKECLSLDGNQSALLFPIAALGIGAGALIAGFLSGRNIEFGIVPIGALGLTLVCVTLSLITPSVIPVLVCIFFVGVASGLFILPLNAFIQYRSPAARRGEILALQNFLSFAGVACSALLIVFLDHVFSMNPAFKFIVVGIMTFILAVTALVVLPDFIVRLFVVIITKTIYRIRPLGIENVPTEGAALLVSNHVTWVDALLLSATTQRRIRFLMARELYDRKLLKPILKLMGVIPVSAKDGPKGVINSLRLARKSLDEGYLVCIFAEGAITRNGNMHGFKPGLERILKGSSYPVIPVYLGGAWGSTLSYYHGKIFSSFKTRLQFPIDILFGSAMPATVTPEAVRLSIMELSGEWFDCKKKKNRTIPQAFVTSARRNWFRHAVSDSTGKELSFGKLLTVSFALGKLLNRRLERSEKMVGLVLPSTAAGALANTALMVMGRVPVNLNFTASAEAVASAIEQCEMQTVISSRSFLEKIQITLPGKIIYIEDLIKDLSSADKIMGLLKAVLMPRWLYGRLCNVRPDDLATIIFSSGSTGTPKGVMLSHHNIISNLEAFLMVFRFHRSDRMCAVLPLFHSFGFTCTLWCPLLRGFSVSYHPNPLDGSGIAELVRERKLSLLLSTPSFLLAYMRKASKEDFASLRSVIVGAEKLKPSIADSFIKKYGLRPFEGYGATELSPVASINIPDYDEGRVHQKGFKEGSIGHPVPGIAAKIVDHETGALKGVGEEGMLLVKGPNVMLGYLADPEKTKEVLTEDGWYVTGDLAKMDHDGFITLEGRLNRYSKIAGEMVPHMGVEDAVAEVIGSIDRVLAVSAAPDEKRGEQLVLFFIKEAGELNAILDAVSKADIPNLWKPKKDNCVPVDSLPMLGSGKLDLKKLQEMARLFAENKKGFIERMIQRIRDVI